MPLPLREYYPIGRAAELLECTVDDLIHWATVGYIRVYLNVEQAYGTVSIFEKHLYPKNINLITDGTKYEKVIDLLNKGYENESGWQEKDNNRLELLRVIYSAMIDYKNKSNDAEHLNKKELKYLFDYLTYLYSGSFRESYCTITLLRNIYANKNVNDIFDSPSEYTKEFLSEHYNFIVKVRGFVGLGCYQAMRLRFGALKEVSMSNSVYLPESSLRIEIISDKEFDIRPEDLFILKSDFITIRNASMGNGEMEKRYFFGDDMENNKHLINVNKKHHLAEHFAQKRESVLGAALFVKVNHPESCTNNTKWAEAIHEHSYTIFGGECPLSLESTKRLLGKVTRNQQHRNKKTMS
ncbi:hypothetical protein SNT90_003930 [Salmonella enterica]|nr:hypothetical protein [Salmonella enterica]